MARSYLSLTPVAGTLEYLGSLRVSPSAYWTALTVNLKEVPVLMFAGYCRGGLDTKEGIEVLQALTRVSDAGRRPFVAMADWNATPSEMEASGWLEILHAKAIAPGQVTAISREVDFALVSLSLTAAVKGVAASWLKSCRPHACIRVALSRDKDDLMITVPRIPRPLPMPGVLQTLKAVQRWEALRSQDAVTKDLLGELGQEFLQFLEAPVRCSQTHRDHPCVEQQGKPDDAIRPQRQVHAGTDDCPTAGLQEDSQEPSLTSNKALSLEAYRQRTRSQFACPQDEPKNMDSGQCSVSLDAQQSVANRPLAAPAPEVLPVAFPASSQWRANSNSLSLGLAMDEVTAPPALEAQPTSQAELDQAEADLDDLEKCGYRVKRCRLEVVSNQTNTVGGSVPDAASCIPAVSTKRKRQDSEVISLSSEDVPVLSDDNDPYLFSVDTAFDDEVILGESPPQWDVANSEPNQQSPIDMQLEEAILEELDQDLAKFQDTTSLSPSMERAPAREEGGSNHSKAEELSTPGSEQACLAPVPPEPALAQVVSSPQPIGEDPIESSGSCTHALGFVDDSMDHPLWSTLGVSSRRAAELGTKWLSSWANSTEDWILEQAEIPEAERARYKGRGTQLAWKKVPIGHCRQGPVRGIKVGTDMSTAGRAIETIRVVCDKLLQSRFCKKFRQALSQLLRSKHDTVQALQAALSADERNRLRRDLQGLKFWSDGCAHLPPANIAARIEAICRRIETARPDDRTRAKLAWVDELLARGASKGHRWANAPNLSLELGLDSKGSYSSAGHLRDQECHFGVLWGSEDEHWRDDFRNAFSELRNKALACDSFPAWLETLKAKLCDGEVKKALTKFKANTSTGADSLNLKWMKSLPDKVLSELNGIILLFASHLVGPIQSMEVWLDLIVKKAAGFRTVATFPSLWRLMMAIISSDFRSWDSDHAEAFDTAVKNRSAGRQIMRRSMEVAIAKSKGQEHAQILWDIAGFYESVLPKQLAKAVVKENVPLQAATLSLWGHAAPRRFRLHGRFSDNLVLPRISLATGCTSSTTLARGLLKGPVQRAMMRAPSLWHSIHIDDYSQEARGHRNAVLEDLYFGGIEFAQAVEEAGLRISSKSVVLASCPHLAKALVRSFRRAGFSLRLEQVSEHLGYARTAKVNKSFTVLKKRFAKAIRRTKRISVLSRLDPRARKLFTTGSLPQAVYGSSLLGLNRQLQDKLDKMALRSQGSLGFQPCKISGIMLTESKLPSVEALAGLICNYITVWAALSVEERKDLQVAWSMLKEAFVSHSKAPWGVVSCSLSATLAALLELGWTPKSANQWIRKEEQLVLAVTKARDEEIIALYRQDWYDKKWAQASQHFTGGGLEEGRPCWHGFKEAMKFLGKKERPDCRNALRRIVAGGVPAGCRFHRNSFCKSCEQTEDSPAHRWYKCPALYDLVGDDQLAVEWLRKTDWLAFEAERHCWKPEIMWFRGLLSHNWSWGMCAQVDSERWSLCTGVDHLPFGYCDGGGDDSRGRPSFAAKVAAGGWACRWSPSQELETCELFMSDVQGSQTIPRAEVTGLLGCTGLSSATEMMVGIDASYTVNGIRNVRNEPDHKLTLSSNGDLWSKVRDVMEYKKLEEVKVTSHQSMAHAREAGVPFHLWAGNAVADVLASVAARHTRLDELTARFAESHASQSFMISVRLALIEAAHLRSEQRTRTWQVLMAGEAKSWRLLTVEANRRLEASGHCLILRYDGKHACTRCGKVRGRGSFSFWTDTACSPTCNISQKTCRSLPAVTMQHGHGQHLLVWHAGAPTCVRCAFTGGLHSFPVVCTPYGADCPARNVAYMDLNSKEYKAVQATHTQQQKEITKLDRTWDAVAVAMLSFSSVAVDHPDDKLPEWAQLIDHSHQIAYAGGLVMCKLCGSLAASNNLKSLLFAAGKCRRELPTGSKSRLQRFLRGRLPYDGTHWPCGIHSKFRLIVWARSFQEGVTLPSIIRDSGDWEESESEGAIRARLGTNRVRVDPDPAISAYVDAALDDALEKFESTDATSLIAPPLDGNPEQLALAIFNFVATKFQEYWVDRLLERSFEIELQLGAWAESLQAQSQTES
eukprot:TRINITY_DN4398_c1_g1_i1.p1 TRINITY_DN4398_c1_g1~~TRINITY_DN4398_c1_g1_i1.p1  ORF type:complete len:2308 (-),score=303.29 TRINITY_DN4398_c1_g1_i1:73-6312(-)